MCKFANCVAETCNRRQDWLYYLCNIYYEFLLNSTCFVSDLLTFVKNINTNTICLQAEDKVDELTKDLLFTRHRLQATEEEKRGKEEEAAMVRVKISICVMILKHLSHYSVWMYL